jgi:hypothetical protein
MLNIAPIITTKVIAFSFSPNHNNAKGNQQILGKVCNPNNRNPTVSFNIRTLAMENPNIVPVIKEKPKPKNMRFKLMIIPQIKIPLANPLNRVYSTWKGEGKSHLGQNSRT